MKLSTNQVWHKHNARLNGIKEGVESMNDKTENLTMLEKANVAFYKWSRDNDITLLNTQPETYRLMSEAFVDGYLKGFTKRLTEGA